MRTENTHLSLMRLLIMERKGKTEKKLGKDDKSKKERNKERNTIKLQHEHISSAPHPCHIGH